MRILSRKISAGCVFVCVLAVLNSVQADEIKGSRLVYVNSVERSELDAVTGVAMSSDGKFLYTAAYQSASLCVFARDSDTGALTYVETADDSELLQGVTSIQLSPDGRFATTAAFRSQAVTLLARDPETGRLQYLDSKKQDVDKGVSGLDWTVVASFSPDGRFVYAIDDRGGVTCFKLTGMNEQTKLEFVEAFRHTDLLGARGMHHHPAGKHVFVACKTSHALVALRRDPDSGKLSTATTVFDEKNGVTGLHSAFGVTVSGDGKFVYVVSGQHGGGKDNCVGVYAFDSEAETLTRLQEIYPAETEVNGVKQPFDGGNNVVFDAAQQNVFASATASGGLAMFQRDTTSGHLKMTQLVHDNERLGWISGLAVSPDNRFLYAAAERLDTIVTFRIESLP